MFESVMMVNETVSSLFNDFNYGRNETKAVMPFCRISVEKYVFSKLNPRLQAMYDLRYTKESAKF